MVPEIALDDDPVIQHRLAIVHSQRDENAPVVPTVTRFVESSTPKARGDGQRDEDGEDNVDADEGAPGRRDACGVGRAAAVRHVAGWASRGLWIRVFCC